MRGYSFVITFISLFCPLIYGSPVKGSGNVLKQIANGIAIIPFDIRINATHEDHSFCAGILLNATHVLTMSYCIEKNSISDLSFVYFYVEDQFELSKSRHHLHFLPISYRIKKIHQFPETYQLLNQSIAAGIAIIEIKKPYLLGKPLPLADPSHSQVSKTFNDGDIVGINIDYNGVDKSILITPNFAGVTRLHSCATFLDDLHELMTDLYSYASQKIREKELQDATDDLNKYEEDWHKLLDKVTCAGSNSYKSPAMLIRFSKTSDSKFALYGLRIRTKVLLLYLSHIINDLDSVEELFAAIRSNREEDDDMKLYSLFSEMKSTLDIVTPNLPQWVNSNDKGFEVNPKDLTVPETFRIIGGKDAYIHEVPFLVSLRMNRVSHSFCGGVLIAPSFVLTAAHCAQKKPEWVSIGNTFSFGDYEGEEIRIKRVYVHPKYRFAAGSPYDFAILELRYPSIQQPIILGTPHVVDKVRFPVATVFGWGVTGLDRPTMSGNLKEADLPLVPSQSCIATFPELHLDTMFCAGGLLGKDGCLGDSGGPLVVNLNDQNILIGIASYGRGCGDLGVPAVYAHLTKCVDFIDKHVRGHKWFDKKMINEASKRSYTDFKFDITGEGSTEKNVLGKEEHPIKKLKFKRYGTKSDKKMKMKNRQKQSTALVLHERLEKRRKSRMRGSEHFQFVAEPISNAKDVLLHTFHKLDT